MVVFLLPSAVPSIVPTSVMPIMISGIRPPGTTSPRSRTISIVQRSLKVLVNLHLAIVNPVSVVPDRTPVTGPLFAPVVGNLGRLVRYICNVRPAIVDVRRPAVVDVCIVIDDRITSIVGVHHTVCGNHLIERDRVWPLRSSRVGNAVRVIFAIVSIGVVGRLGRVGRPFRCRFLSGGAGESARIRNASGSKARSGSQLRLIIRFRRLRRFSLRFL